METAALVHRRLETTELRVFFDALLPAITVRCVDEHLHRAGQVAHLAALRRRPSLVDWVSFEMMREQAIDSAFAFDRDFVDQGFAVVP